MKIEQIRVYAEVLEQGIDFKEYIENSGIKCSVINIYSHKARGEISETDSIVTRIRKSKDVDVLITAISDCKEYDGRKCSAHNNFCVGIAVRSDGKNKRWKLFYKQQKII